MKNNLHKTIKLLTALGVAGLVTAAHAQTTNVIFGTDFDGGGNFSFSYGYTYAGSSAGGAAAGFSGGTPAAGVGVAGSSAFSGSPDYTPTATDVNYNAPGAIFTYSGTAAHLVFNGPITPLETRTSLDSFVLSFDVKLLGLLTNLNNAEVSIDEFDFQTAGNNVIQFTGSGYTAGSNFVHFDIPLSALNLTIGSAADFTNNAILSAIDGFVVEFRVKGEVGSIGVDRKPVFGFDNDNSLIVDNVYLREVSETPPVPKFERTLMDINFDDKLPGFAYSFIFRDGANSATVTTSTNATGGVGSSAALVGTADLTSWQATPPTVFSGFGAGVAASAPYTLTATNKAAYRLYLTAKAGGLSGFDSANGNLSIQFLVPPGTLTPSNPAPAVVLELAPSVTFSNSFQSFVLNDCPIGIFVGGSQALFNQYVQQVNQVQVQAQFNGGPDLGSVFGYDSDNTITLDNIKLVELATGIPSVSVTKTNSQIKVYWADPYNTGTAKLQSSTNVAGPYVDVAGAATGAASPYTVPTGSSQKFFRTKWVP